MELTNFSYGGMKLQAMNNSFGDAPAENVIELNKAIQAGSRNGLTLKDVTDKNGNKTKRWVNANGDEHAPHGSKATFTHNGQQVTGTVGRVSKSSGKYVIKGEDGTEYKKHHHEIQPHTDGGTKANGANVDADDDKTNKSKSDIHSLANQRTDDELKKFITRHKDDDDFADAVKAAEDVLADRAKQGKADKSNNAPPDADEEDDSTDDDEKGSDDHVSKVVDHIKSGGKYGSRSKNYMAEDHDGKGKFRISDNGKKTITDEAGLKKFLSSKISNKKVADIEAKATKTAQDIEDESDEQEEEDVNERFEDFADYVEGVVMGLKKSAIMYGSGGVGKTWTTTQKLKDLGLEFFNEDAGHQVGDDQYDVATFEGGKISPQSFYQAMWNHNGKILVFDDCDSALEHPDIKGFLKGALGSNQSTVTNATAANVKDANGNTIPKQFKFNGKMIFISNLPKKYMMGKEMQPIMSRSFSTDMTMNRKETLDRIKHIATDKGTGKLTNMKFDGIPNYSHEEMEGVLNMIDKYKDKAYDLNARTVETLLGMRKLADKKHGAGTPEAQKDFERKAKKNLLQHLDKDGNDITKSIHNELHTMFTNQFAETLAYANLGYDVTAPFEKSINEAYVYQAPAEEEIG